MCRVCLLCEHSAMFLALRSLLAFTTKYVMNLLQE